MKNVKSPNVAGSFYPSEKLELGNLVKSFLNKVPNRKDQKVPRALIAPHAGYIYSGPIAATAYNELINLKENIQTVALLSPSHYFGFESIALTDATHFSTPLGEIPVNLQVMEKLNSFPQVEVLPRAFKKEHALEVHLPFLQTVLGEFDLIPMVVGQLDPQKVSDVIDFFDKEKIFIVISSDLSHFHDYELAKIKDEVTKKAFESMDYTNLSVEDACGYYPLCGLLKWAKQKNLKLETLDMRNSGDTAGDKSRVVGYGSYIVY